MLYKIDTSSWSVERAVFLIAGIFIVVSVALSVIVNFFWLFFIAFVGLMMMIFALTGYCPMAIILDKFGVGKRDK